jgi:hypothetical protein
MGSLMLSGGGRGFFERRGRKGFAESAKEDREKRKPKKFKLNQIGI